MANNQSKKKAVDATKIISDVIEASDIVEVVEPVETPSNEFVWVDPSPALHDRLNVLLRRRGTHLGAIMQTSEEMTEQDFAGNVREYAGFDRADGVLNDDVWLAVLARLER